MITTEIVTKTLIIGTGCAGLNAADCLWNEGERDFIIVTEGINNGTSRNTGSDKQTYYKLSLAGNEGDSVLDMAKALKNTDTDGDISLCEAASSATCFLKLASLGVPFPCNDFGEYVAYRTDHDTRKRASSAGPLTSKFMTEALEKSVLQKGIRIIEHVLIYRFLTDAAGIIGAEGYNISEKKWVRFRCANIIMCTGGPAHIYRSRVYPDSQHGMSSVALNAGAEANNLHCWQYGLASVDFKWNVSGSYQQVLPRYISVDENGNEFEFLDETLDVKHKLELCFLKGYEWPFDEAKINGSSKIDLLVKAQEEMGRAVYLDYMHDPSGFSEENLSNAAFEYLSNSNALLSKPIERLKAMNAPAIELYKSHGIDLENEMLRISVCAQHHNGGIAVDSNWESSVEGLYVCGEAAGTFGHKRPGGTALNSTQVGSMRAAKHISISKRTVVNSLPVFVPPMLPTGEAAMIKHYLQSQMSLGAAFVRKPAVIAEMLEYLDNGISYAEASIGDIDYKEQLLLYDIITTQKYVLQAMLFDEENKPNGVLVSKCGRCFERPGRPIPERDLWFESVWAKSMNRG